MPTISIQSETRILSETDTVSLRQVTDHPSIHHHPFFFVDAWDTAMSFLLLISHRSCTPQIYIERAPGAELIQLTEEPALAEWSVIPSKDGQWIYYVAGQEGKRVSPRDGSVETLVRFDSTEMREAGMVGAAMGTTALSASGRYWAVPVKTGAVSRFWLIDTERQSAEVFLEAPTIGHPQFCPDDEDLILYAGPMTDRVWVTDRAGNARRIFKRAHDMQWITHEVWRPGHRTVLFVDWPNGMGEIDPDTGRVAAITDFPVWHGAPDATGEQLVCDTNFPDRGLHLLDLAGAQGPRFLTAPEASSQGAHWAHPFPYNNGPVKVHAPQHTHPHPRFSPDGRQVVFTSDASGFAQVFVATLR
ncbi:TolB family protein [Salipiger abyssi]|uniref:TolB family protein n=1 Tax=Salipiger abyssi TaxID=1250539 RepID=UPI001A8FDC37|nr:PD40 domain-containing protein [Salipiger abyssi]MBN9887174.1 PD40 domain-containing protein [Salipiger abyssi]